MINHETVEQDWPFDDPHLERDLTRALEQSQSLFASERVNGRQLQFEAALDALEDVANDLTEVLEHPADCISRVGLSIARIEAVRRALRTEAVEEASRSSQLACEPDRHSAARPEDPAHPQPL